MTTGSDDALDVALGLLRAPALRTALRARPLPDGMVELLAIASGSPERARAAAARTGHGEDELLEAARFYVQQVLLAEDADAYRVLGVQRHAAHDEIRDHHRHLLRWLHPDRSEGAQWDSAFATRVNQAWNQLRLQSTRSGYDAALVAQDVAVGSASAPRPLAGAAMIPAPQREIAAPLTVLLLAVLCIVLAWFAVHRKDSLDDPFAAAPRAAVPATPGIVERMSASLPHRIAGVEVTGAVPRPAAAPSSSIPDATATVPISASAAPSAEQFMAAVVPAPPSAAQARRPAAEGRRADLDAATARRNAAADASAFAAVDVPDAPGTPAQEDPLALFSEAESAVRGIRAYLAGQGGAEPAWLDMSTGLEGAGIRAQLRARHVGAARLRMGVDAPGWTLDTHVATMLGAYRVDDRRGIVETGLLRVELARRDAHWRVARLHLEPAR